MFSELRKLSVDSDLLRSGDDGCDESQRAIVRVAPEKGPVMGQSSYDRSGLAATRAVSLLACG
ncbi:MAG TPA: hypothetical protein DDW52_01390 [Planctomycetaceae bacterium]|nr:hypothetical protein [Planctomycetaceae bacterium]